MPPWIQRGWNVGGNCIVGHTNRPIDAKKHAYRPRLHRRQARMGRSIKQTARSPKRTCTEPAHRVAAKTPSTEFDIESLLAIKDHRFTIANP